MENIEKKGLLTRIQDYLDSPKGRILLNYLYSWGAAVVILGALFKLTHIKGANLMLFIGMGTEVLVFFISGFEKPFIPKQDDEDDDYEAPRVRGSIIINNAAPQSAPQQPVQAPAAAAAAEVFGCIHREMIRLIFSFFTSEKSISTSPYCNCLPVGISSKGSPPVANS